MNLMFCDLTEDDGPEEEPPMENVEIVPEKEDFADEDVEELPEEDEGWHTDNPTRARTLSGSMSSICEQESDDKDDNLECQFVFSFILIE